MLTLGFDGAGNRTQITGSWAPNTYGVNALNQYTSDAIGTGSYDIKGNLSGYAGWVLTYDAANRLIGLDNNGANQHILYSYDLLNRRVAQRVNGQVTSYVFDNWNQIEERPTDGRQPRCFLFGGATNEVVVSFGSGYQNYFYSQDGRGNTSHLSDNSNNLIERYTYDLNGVVSYFDGNNNPVGTRNPTADNRFLFAGAILLPETSLYDMRNRMYFPRWGRFLQTDPIGFKGDASNLYRYCGNDFVDKSDPMGLAASDTSHFLPDRMWEMAHHSDPANTFHGNFQQYMEAKFGSPQVHPVESKAKPGQLRRWQAKSALVPKKGMFGTRVWVKALTRPTLNYPVAGIGPDGKIRVTQTVDTDTIYGSSATPDDRRLEETNISAIRGWMSEHGADIAKNLPNTASSLAEAADQMDRAIRPKFDDFMGRRAIMVDGPGGEHTR